MKTIDLLVQALPAIGGWPEKVTHIGQDYDRELMFYGRGNVRSGIFLDQLAADHRKHGEKGTKITREQYEAALAAKKDGWIEWDGGECPVPGDTEVLIKCKSEGAWDYRRKQRADEVAWTHDDSVLDVIAYRLHQLQQAEQPESSEEDLNECIGQAPTTEWNGDGLIPPVGCECQYRKHRRFEQGKWFNGVVKYASEFTVVIQAHCYPGETVGETDNFEFRPLRSEADRKREEAKFAIAELCRSSASNGHSADLIYDAIAAGKVPGVKLEG